MIRRREYMNDLGDRHDVGPASVASAVKRGESVRVVGLGTLARVEIDTTGPAPWNFPGPRKGVYRLTLTAAVARAFGSYPGHTSEDMRLMDDVRHIARALGALVEVWAPGACRPRPMSTVLGGWLITTVKP